MSDNRVQRPDLAALRSPLGNLTDVQARLAAAKRKGQPINQAKGENAPPGKKARVEPSSRAAAKAATGQAEAPEVPATTTAQRRKLRVKRAQARKAQEKKASAQNFASAQSETVFEPSNKRARLLQESAPTVDAAHAAALKEVANNPSQGAVLPPPSPQSAGQAKMTPAKIREVLRNFISKSADYMDFARSMLPVDAASTELVATPPSMATGAGAVAVPQAQAAAMPAASASATPASASTAASRTNSAQDSIRPENTATFGDVLKGSYASIPDGPNAWKLIMLMMNQKRMERAFILMMESQRIETNLNKAKIAEITTQMLLVLGSVDMDRVQAMADFAQNLAQAPNQFGKDINEHINNTNLNLPRDGQNAWTPDLPNQARGPAADLRATQWLDTVASGPENKPRMHGEQVNHQKDKQYLFTPEQIKVINDYNSIHKTNPQNRILTETYPGSGKHIKVQFLSEQQLGVLKRMDEYAKEKNVELHLFDTYKGNQDLNIQGVLNDMLANRRDDIPGRVMSRDQDFKRHLQAADEAEAHADELKGRAKELRESGSNQNLADAEEAENAAKEAQKYAHLHRTNANLRDPEKGMHAQDIRENNIYNYDSMEMSPGHLENLQLGAVHAANRSYHSYIDEIEEAQYKDEIKKKEHEKQVEEARRKGETKVPKLDELPLENQMVRDESLNDMRRREIMNHRALSQKMHTNTSPFSSAGDSYRQMDLAIGVNNASIKKAEDKLTQLPPGSKEAQELGSHLAELRKNQPLLETAKKRALILFSTPAQLTHRENRFRTGATQARYEVLMAHRATIDHMPLNSAAERENAGWEWLCSQAAEREFGISPPHQQQAADLFHSYRVAGQEPTARIDAGDFGLISPSRMLKHCKEVQEDCSKVVATLEPKKDQLSPEVLAELNQAEALLKHVPEQIDHWKKRTSWAKEVSPGAPRKRFAEAAKTGNIDLSPAPKIEKRITQDEHGDDVIVRVPVLQGDAGTEGDEELSKKSFTDGKNIDEIKKIAEAKLNTGRVDYLNKEKYGKYLKATETGGRMAVTGYHDPSVEGVMNLQVLGNFLPQLQDPLTAIQQYTEGDPQNASQGAAALSDEASSAVQNSFQSDFDQIEPMIKRLNSIMNSFSGF